MPFRPRPPTAARRPLASPVHSPVHSPVRAIGAALLVASCLSACGGGDSTVDKSAGSNRSAGGPMADVRYLAGYLADWYLWYRDLPAIDPAQYASDQALLDAVRVPQDWYSYIDSASTFNAFYDEGRATGYGFGYALLPDGTMWIRYVQPLSNAGAAGLRRGDRVTAIGGVPLATILAGAGVDSALGPTQAGVSTTLTILRDGQAADVPLTKSDYPVRTVIDRQLIDTPRGRVGYLVFTAFTNPAQAEWSEAIGALLDAGATDLIVDLRENGGGRLGVAAVVASSLAPAASAGTPAVGLQFNDRHEGSNQTLDFSTTTGTGRVGRLVWITSPRTCSASEAVMSALRPVRDAYAVGETTCGKPVGFSPPQFDGKVYNIVTFQIINRAGLTGYYKGLTPDCAAAEDYSRPFGSPDEPKLAAALQYLADGSCRTTGSSKAQRPTAAPPTGFGIEKLTGLR